MSCEGVLIRHCDVIQKGKMSQDVIHKQDTTTQSLAGRHVREYTYIHAELQISAVMSLADKYSKVSIYKIIFSGTCLADDDDNKRQGEVEAVMLFAATRNHVP